MKAKSRGGRPSFKPTAAQRRQVSVAAGAGCSHEAIAIALDITPPTLRKHFQRELTVGAHQRRLEVITGLHDAATNGSAAAAKAYLALGVKPTEPTPPADPAGDAPTPEPLGKKAAADENAKTVHRGSSWEQLLEPPETVQ